MANAWKIYFWFMVLVTVIFSLFIIAVMLFGLFPAIGEEFDQLFSVEGWYSMIFSLVTLIPLFGIAYGKKILILSIWKAVLIWQIADFIWGYLLDTKPNLIAEPFSLYSISMISVMLLFVIPVIVANYIYAFKSNDIWS